jgi:hypothetical protein
MNDIANTKKLMNALSQFIDNTTECMDLEDPELMLTEDQKNLVRAAQALLEKAEAAFIEMNS